MALEGVRQPLHHFPWTVSNSHSVSQTTDARVPNVTGTRPGISNSDQAVDRSDRHALEPQFHAPNGTQNVNNGSGPQVANSAFNGPVYFNQSSTRNDVMRMLYTSQYQDCKDRNPRRVPGTCEWFLSHRSFVEFRETESSAMLWVSADPGCGKSVLVKHLVDEVLLPTDSRAVCYFFFKDDFDDRKSLSSALCCLLRQLFLQKPHLLSEKVANRFLAGGSTITKSSSELWEILTTASTRLNSGEIIFVLDALDECEEQGRTELYLALEDLPRKKGAGTIKFLLASRPYAEINRGLKHLSVPDLPVVHLSGESPEEVEKISTEIDLVIRARVEDARRRLDLTSDERDLLLAKLMNTPQRTYLWASLVLDSTSNLLDIDEDGIRHITSELPRSVDEAYDKILCRSPDPEAAEKLLHIIVGAYNPLTLAEVSGAFFIKQHDRKLSDVKCMSDDRFERFLRHVCGLLVAVTNRKIYLLHQTVKEFLVPDATCLEGLGNNRLNWLRKSPGAPKDLQWKHALRPHDSHWILANACIWHLVVNSERIGTVPNFYRSSLHPRNDTGSTFLGYCLLFWYRHVCLLSIGSQEAITPSILQVCQVLGPYIGSPGTACEFMIACDYGLSTVAKHLLSLDGILVYARDNDKRTVLIRAAMLGQNEVMKVLVDHINGPDFGPSRRLEILEAADSSGNTSLWYAVARGSLGVVRTLLEAGACATATDNGGRTLLHRASSVVRESEVWRLLLEAGADPRARDVCGETALHAATEWKRGPDIVQLLIDFGADFEARVGGNSGYIDRGYKGYTPLHYAARSGDLETVRLYLRLGAQRDVRNGRGETPLDLAR